MARTLLLVRRVECMFVFECTSMCLTRTYINSSLFTTQYINLSSPP
jgi:hypothetical protein